MQANSCLQVVPYGRPHSPSAGLRKGVTFQRVAADVGGVAGPVAGRDLLPADGGVELPNGNLNLNFWTAESELLVLQG
jgi:hypothetical protein